MRVETLIATMGKQDYALLDRMNVQTDAVVIHQTDCFSCEEKWRNDRRVLWYSFAEFGVGRSRNTALDRAREEIVLFADDDLRYDDGYEEKIVRFYQKHPNADVVLFQFRGRERAGQVRDKQPKIRRMGKKSLAKYGAVNVSARLSSIRRANVHFHLLFGGGAEFGCGEDTIFLQDCFKKGLVILASEECLGEITKDRPSTWFQGYNDKYFFDKGVLFYTVSPILSQGIALYHAIKHRRNYPQYGWRRGYNQIKRGIQEARLRDRKRL